MRLFWTLQARSDLINIWRSINGVNFMFEKQTGSNNLILFLKPLGTVWGAILWLKNSRHVPIQFEDTFKNTQWWNAKFLLKIDIVTGIGLRSNYGWKIVDITTHVLFLPPPPTLPCIPITYTELHCYASSHSPSFHFLFKTHSPPLCLKLSFQT